MELSRPFAPPSINVPLLTSNILHPSSFSRSITVEMADPHMPAIQQKIATLLFRSGRCTRPNPPSPTSTLSRTTLDNTLGFPTKDRGPDGNNQSDAHRVYGTLWEPSMRLNMCVLNNAWKGKGKSEIQTQECPHFYGWVMEKWHEGPIKDPRSSLRLLLLR